MQTNGEKNKTYWNNIAYQFLQQKHNADISCQGIPIKIYTGGLPHKPFFIANSIQGILIIGPTKKMVAMYAVGDLALMDSWGHKCSSMSIVIIYISCFIGVQFMATST